MDKIEMMKVFATVARLNSFTKAASETGMAVQTVSKYVKSLEDDLNVQLFDRTTRKVTLNQTGKAYLERCQDVLSLFEEVESSVRDIHTAPTGKIRITAPTAFGEYHLVPQLAEFQNLYPDIEIELNLTNRRVSIVDEGFDLSIRIGQLTDSSMIAKKLTKMRVTVCASPEYLAQHGVPLHPRDLIDHNCLIDANVRFGKHWPFVENGQTFSVEVNGNFQANSPASMIKMVASGLGISMCPYYVMSNYVISGAVIPLFEDMEAIEYGVYAIYPHRKHLSKRVRTLVDFLAQKFRNMQ